MCRIIAFYGAHDIQSALLTAFKRLSVIGKVPKGAEPGHKDGWGILTYEDSIPQYLGRVPTDPYVGLEYDRMLESVRSIHARIILGHLRKASSGSRSVENTQPFTNSQWSFAHNGTIWSPGLNWTGSEIDSKAYFSRLLQSLVSSDSNAEDVLASTVREIRNDVTRLCDSKGKTYSSLTCILSDGKSIYAVRDFADRKNEDYYTMYYSALEDGIVFCQEKIIESNWVSIPNRTLAAFHGDGEIRKVSCE